MNIVMVSLKITIGKPYL